MQLDKHFMYLPALSLDPYSEAGRTPCPLPSLIARLDELEEQEMGVLFDMTRPEGDILGHPDASVLLQACEERGIAVAVRVAHPALKACKASLDVLSQRGWLSEIRLVASREEIEKSGFFQGLLKLDPESLRRTSLEIDILSLSPASLDALSKSILPDERRDTDIAYNPARAMVLPRILLRLDPDSDPFEPGFEASMIAWRAELTGLLRVARIAFDVAAYQALQPHRIASFVRPVGKKSPVFFVNDAI